MNPFVYIDSTPILRSSSSFRVSDSDRRNHAFSDGGLTSELGEVSSPKARASYRLRVHRRFPNKSMRQVVIYLKPTGSDLVRQNVFSISGLRHEFEIIRLWEQPSADLLKFPGLLPLAVLGRSDDKTQTLREVSSIIDTIEEKREQSNIAAATSILAGLVLNKEVIRAFLREEIMQESVIYQDIVAKATAKGKAEGKAEGVKEGEISVLLRQLKRRLGQIEAEDENRINQLSVEQLEALGEALLDFSNRDDLLAWLDNHGSSGIPVVDTRYGVIVKKINTLG